MKPAVRVGKTIMPLLLRWALPDVVEGEKRGLSNLTCRHQISRWLRLKDGFLG